MKQNIIKRLSEIGWMLERPDTIIGGVEPRTRETLIMKDGKFEYETIEFVPGLGKIIDEIFDNSIDEAIRTNFKFANEINVKFENGTITIKDNGRGVPQTLMDDGTIMAVAAFTEPRTGTNYDEATKAEGSIGRNGVGSFAANVFSKKFKVITDDGTTRLTLVCQNNMESFEFTQTPIKTRGTTVEFQPDLKRFGVETLDSIYVDLIKQRMVHLAQQFPIKFTLIDNSQELF